MMKLRFLDVLENKLSQAWNWPGCYSQHQQKTHSAAYLSRKKMIGKPTKLPSRVPGHFRKSWVCSGWWLGRLRLKNFNECHISCANIEACHRLKSKANPKRVIIKLSERANVFNILQRKKKLKSADITNVSLPEGSLVFKYQTLCSYYEHLWSLCKRLHLKKMILKNW